MKIITIDEFKANFSEVVKQVKSGESFAITDGDKNEVFAHFIPQQASVKKIILGIAEGEAKFIFAPDFKMTEEEFLGL